MRNEVTQQMLIPLGDPVPRPEIAPPALREARALLATMILRVVTGATTREEGSVDEREDPTQPSGA